MRYITILSFAAIICFAVILINSEFILNDNENKRLEFEKFIRNHPFNQKETLTPSGWKKKLPKKDRPDLAMEQDFFMTMDPELKRVPKERLIIAYEYADELRKSLHRGNTSAWTEHGPNNVAGRTRAIMFDPNDITNKKVWAGGVSGGLWFTTDITSSSPTWTKVDDFWDNMAVSCIASDPVNPQIFYVGTGEIYTGASRGFGIWKTIDGGNTWGRLSSTNEFLWVNDIVVRNENGIGVIYAAIGDSYYEGAWGGLGEGLYRSTDGGYFWTQVMGNIENYPYQVSDIEIDKDHNIWVGTRPNSWGSGGGTIMFSSNGEDWAVKYNATDAKRVELVCAPSNENVIYAIGAAVAGGDNDIAFFIRSDDGGTTWNPIEIPLNQDNLHFTRSQADYDLILAVAPNDKNILYAGGINLHKSIDGGTTWDMISVWHSYYANQLNIEYVHADQHSFAFRPNSPNTIIFGNDGGIHMTSDAGNTFEAKNTGYNITQFYSAALHPQAGNNYFLAGSQDNGTQKFQNASGIVSTVEATGGDGGYCFIDQNNPLHQITSYVYNNYYGSEDGGLYFNDLTDPYVEDNTGRFINPSDYDDNSQILYSASNSDSLKRTYGLNDAEHIFINLDLGQASHIRVSEYTDHTIFIGTGLGNLFKFENANSNSPSREDITGSNFPTGYISCVELGASENQLLVTFSNYGVTSIFESTDGGTTWVSKDKDILFKDDNLPDMPVRWALYNPEDRNEVILATEIGIWYTSDFSTSVPQWEPSIDGLANVRVDMLKIRQSDNLVIAATHGRGLFSSTMFQGGTCTATEVANSDKSTTDSVTGTTGAVVAVTCNSGYGGGGDWTCGTNGIFTGTECSANSCTATTVANSDKSATGSVTGTTGTVVTVTCNSGYSGGGSWTCGIDGTFSGTVCLDDDECTLDTDNCDSNATCTNIVGSFTCACNSGYSGDGTNGNCITLSLYSALIPEEYSIHNIYPNPFNPVANINYGVAENSKVQIVIYDMSGKKVESIVNKFQTPGYYSVSWNANNQPSGVYFVKMIADEYITTQKLMLVK